MESYIKGNNYQDRLEEEIGKPTLNILRALVSSASHPWRA